MQFCPQLVNDSTQHSRGEFLSGIATLPHFACKSKLQCSRKKVVLLRGHGWMCRSLQLQWFGQNWTYYSHLPHLTKAWKQSGIEQLCSGCSCCVGLHACFEGRKWEKWLCEETTEMCSCCWQALLTNLDYPGRGSLLGWIPGFWSGKKMVNSQRNWDAPAPTACYLCIFRFFLSAMFENLSCCWSTCMPQEQSLGSCYYLNFNLLSCVLILLGHRSTLRKLSRCSLAAPLCPQKSDRPMSWISFGPSQKINSSCTGLTGAFDPGELGEYLQERGWEAFPYMCACGCMFWSRSCGAETSLILRDAVWGVWAKHFHNINDY